MTYTTDNIAIAAALRLNGYQIKNITLSGRKASFHFSAECKQDALDIQLGKVLVDAISFHQELRHLSALAKSMSEAAHV
jgi:hypothetical protein